MPRLTTFDGMFPKVDGQNLPPNAAELAIDCDLYGARIDPLPALGPAGPIVDIDGEIMTGPVRTLHRAGKVWVGFPEHTFVAPDPSERAGEDSFLFVRDGRLWRSSGAWVTDKDGPVPVGIEPPCNGPFASVMAGEGTAVEFPALLCDRTREEPDPENPEGPPIVITEPAFPDPNDLECAPDADAPEARAYVFTYVTECHEESAPSHPSNIVDVRNGDSVALVDTNAEVPAHAVERRWYRSIVTTDGLALWHFVAATPIEQPGFIDDVPALALGEALFTEDHLPPPACLEGVAVMGDAVTVVWSGDQFWMSEPRLPHAYPPLWRKRVRFPILSILGSTQPIEGQETFLGYVITKGTPYFLSGVRPEEVVPREYEVWEPGASRHCACVTDGGVVYASTQALMLLQGTTAVAVLSPETTDVEWKGFDPAGLQLAFWNAQLWGVSERAGFKLPVSHYREDRGRFLTMLSVRATALFSAPDTPLTFVPVGAVPHTAQLGAMQGHQPYLWKSRVFTLPGQWWPAAFKVVADWPRRPRDLAKAQQQLVRWKQLHCTTAGFFEAYPQFLELEPWLFSSLPRVRVRLYADGELVYERSVDSSEPVRTPKRRGIDWQFEVRGTIPVKEFHFETSIQDLTQLGQGVGNSV